MPITFGIDDLRPLAITGQDSLYARPGQPDFLRKMFSYILTQITHKFGGLARLELGNLAHEKTNAALPPHVRLSYDGMKLEFEI
jgi:hypothetical protein